MQNTAPLERQSTADFSTQPAMPMQCLLFIYSRVAIVQISALTGLSSIKLVFSVNSLVLLRDSRFLLVEAVCSPRVANVLSAPRVKQLSLSLPTQACLC